MNKKFVGTFLVIFVVATVFFVVGQTSLTPKVSNKATHSPISKVSNNSQLSKLEEEAEQSAQQGIQSEIDQMEQSFSAKIQEMDTLVREAKSPVPEEHQETPQEKEEFEALIAKIEQETGQKFTGDIGSFELDPVEHKEYYELEQKFDALDDQMRQIVNEL